MRSKKIFFGFFLLLTSNSYSQWVAIDTNYYFLKYKEVVKKNGDVVSCSLKHKVNDSLKYYYYTNLKNPNNLYFECKYNSGIIIESGFYKLIYNEKKYETLFNETYFCWQRDLIWNYYEKQQLKKIEFYDEGRIQSIK